MIPYCPGGPHELSVRPCIHLSTIRPYQSIYLSLHLSAHQPIHISAHQS
ncbi:unnamed protein product, partial [Staurois parvus]